MKLNDCHQAKDVTLEKIRVNDYKTKGDSKINFDDYNDNDDYEYEYDYGDYDNFGENSNSGTGNSHNSKMKMNKSTANENLANAAFNNKILGFAPA